MRYLIIFLLWISTTTFLLNAQQIEGIVLEPGNGNKGIPAIGAKVYWNGTKTGALTDAEGRFEIEVMEGYQELVVSYSGYKTDTIVVEGLDFLEIKLKEVFLDAVEINTRQKSNEISKIDPIKVERISESELLKAACCNLSESFETTPSVDVAFTDAISGTRQIMMLGLAGPYTQITTENMPDVRGFAALYGLTYTPGHWVKGILLNKGTGSVVNGFESVSGQINVELRKPQNSDKLFANLYANESGRFEANVTTAHKISDRWSTGFLLHGMSRLIKQDRNGDGFMDNPLTNHLIVMNRWRYVGKNGIRTQFGVKGTFIDQVGGQMAFGIGDDPSLGNVWGMKINTRRMEVFAKLGKVFPEKPWRSVGSQYKLIYHDQDSDFGPNKYKANQNSFYANVIYQTIITDTRHKIKTGASLMIDDYNEELNGAKYDRDEYIPGVFAEYTYSPVENFDMVAGLRGDFHNLYGAFATPRMHIRYVLKERNIFRISGGRGQRTANIFAENNAFFATSRKLIVLGDDSDKPYGLDAEIAWNYGINFTHNFTIDYRDGQISFDFYRTDFQNQIVIDLDQSAQEVRFYNLDGKSYSNSFQVQAEYEVVKRLDVRLAYRLFDVRTNYGAELLLKPFVSRHRAFANIAYAGRKNWKVDYTINWQGMKRIPSTATSPPEYQLPSQSPDFVMMNAQVSKTWRERFEVYVGMENILNFKQENPIVASDQPFGPNFDSSMIWGPIFGRNTYAGLRYKIFAAE